MKNWNEAYAIAVPIHRSRILYEDDSLLAVNKLSGELVVRGKGNVGKLPLLDLLRKDHPGLRAVHRLDFATSGVVIFAKTKAAEQAIVASKFAGWQKTYRTLAAGRMEKNSGEIRKPLPARAGGSTRLTAGGSPTPLSCFWRSKPAGTIRSGGTSK